MIDFHTHILPGIDDGSRNEKESVEMLIMEQEQDVNRIILTPHFYADRDGRDYFDRRCTSYERLIRALEKESISGISFILGSEVCYFTGIGESEIADRLCIGNSKYMLLEMPFDQWDKKVFYDVKALIERGIKIIIAHIERYYILQRDMRWWKEIFCLPVISQINSGALYRKWTTRNRIKRFIKTGHEIILGSDCHNIDNRKPNLLNGMMVLQKKYGSEVMADIDNRSECIYSEIARSI